MYGCLSQPAGKGKQTSITLGLMVFRSDSDPEGGYKQIFRGAMSQTYKPTIFFCLGVLDVSDRCTHHLCYELLTTCTKEQPTDCLSSGPTRYFFKPLEKERGHGNPSLDPAKSTENPVYSQLGAVLRTSFLSPLLETF